ncbi:MAG: P-loop NTPase [Bacilli bacterium]
MSECNHNCESCEEKCEHESLLKKAHPMSSIKKVIGVVSGKGGVGKSLVTSLLAINLRQKGYQVGVLDADITGPSIPKIFGIKDKTRGNKGGLLPNVSSTGIKIVSSNLLLKNDTDPVVWRGPIVSNLVEQFWTEVIWQDIDFLLVDLPPGTGDVPLTVFQSMSVDGIIIVTSPQELVKMIVSKAVKMANMMKIPVLGLVENMSYLECDQCHHKIKIFGESHVEEIGAEYGIPVLAKIPLNPKISEWCDAGLLEKISVNYLEKASATLENLPIHFTTIAIPVDDDQVSEHFGQTPTFLMVQSVKKMVIQSFMATASQIGHDGIMSFLKEHQVNVVLTKNIGELMRDLVVEQGIQIVVGVDGVALDAARKYLRNELKGTSEANCSCDHEDCGDCDGSTGCK